MFANVIGTQAHRTFLVAPLRRALAAWVALLAILLLPVAHEIHLRSDHDAAPAVVAGVAQPPTPHEHDAGHCAICTAFAAIDVGIALLTFAILLRAEIAPRFNSLRYVAPPLDGLFLSPLAVPRGPPALA